MIYSLDEIREHIMPVAEKYHLPAVYVFGSYARGTAREDSDIDLLVDTEGTDLKSMFSLGALYNDFESVLDKEIDMVTVDTLDQDTQMLSQRILRANVKKERVVLYVV